MIYAVKTTAKQENTVAEMIGDKEAEGIHAVISPEDMTSYVMVEADSTSPIERILEEIPHANGVIQDPMGIAEIEHFLEPSSDVENISENDLVELTDGPFQGERAQVQRIDEGNEQVTVELHEATVPIPVTVRGDQLRRLDSDER